MSQYQRIACLSTEAVEVMYAIGAEDLIAGISGYTVRPARQRRKSQISGFSSAKLDRILAVKPDLVLAYSNMQSDLCKELVSAGVEVHCFNQHSVDGIYRMIATVGLLTGRSAEAAQLTETLQQTVQSVLAQSRQWTRRPRVYFEEWNEPLMSGIGWVSELIASLAAMIFSLNWRTVIPVVNALLPIRWKWCGVLLTSSSVHGVARSFSRIS
jgi:iron complex transport system substrate-binding protein